MLRLLRSQGNSDKIRAGFHLPLNFQSCSCLSEDSTQVPWNPTRGPSELQPGSSCQTSLGRLAVKLKRSWFNMDFLPWSLEWSQVIGIKSDKGVQLVVHWEGSDGWAKCCPCNKMMFSSMLQYLRLGERISSLLRVERGKQDASLTMKLDVFLLFFFYAALGETLSQCESKLWALRSCTVQNLDTSMASNMIYLSCLHSFQYLVHAMDNQTD